jgi:hypothetical protein
MTGMETHEPMRDPLTIAEIDAVREYCRQQVTRRAAFSGALAAVPLPMLDAAADLGILMRLLPKISAEFELRPEDIARQDPESRAVIYTAAKALGDSFVGKIVTKRMIAAVLARLGTRVAGKSLAKYAPVVGQVASASLSFALMRHIGLKHVEDCYTVARARAEARLFGGEGMVIDGVALRERVEE